MTTKTLQIAMDKASELPEAAQEHIGRELLVHLDRLTTLRAEIDIGVQELDSGLGSELDIEAFLKEARMRHAK